MIPINCKIIGLTGGIASGKSSLSSILIEKEFQVIDADKIAREVVQINKPAYKDIIDYFGRAILNKNGTINRKKLGMLVFSDNNLLKTLNQITHPYIYEEIKKRIRKLCNQHYVIFIDIPLLFEEHDNIRKHKIIFDEIWLIYVDRKTQLKRLMERDSLSIDQANKRIDAQMSLEDKRLKATRVIDNRGSKSELLKNIDKELERLLQ